MAYKTIICSLSSSFFRDLNFFCNFFAEKFADSNFITKFAAVIVRTNCLISHSFIRTIFLFKALKVQT